MPFLFFSFSLSLIYCNLERVLRKFTHAPGASTSNVTLVHTGFLGGSPTKPKLAFAFSVFELYRQLHRVCPRLSIQAFSKALDHLHHVPVNSYLADQFSSAYDCYLEIIHEVDALVNTAMGTSLKEQFQERVCPPCLYKVDDEPDMKYSLLGAMDGNVSLKLFNADFRRGESLTDNRVLENERWLKPEFVDQFKDEVTNSKKPTTPQADPAPITDPGPSTPQLPAPGDGVGDDNSVNTCVERWRNAGPEARKKMFALFAVSGIFVTVCRHGHVLLICDMIRSGELMKYPIAHVRALLDRYGAGIGIGYDIFCQLIKTLRRSSLGQDVAAMSLDGVVPAFHGYAHNRLCQLSWHPLYKDGTGIEDFEECERTFSKSNNLAAVTRLATPYHRHQQIEEHFQFHDLDKYASSGTFIYQNYIQALECIQIDGAALREFEEGFEQLPDYEKALADEQAYLIALKTEEPFSDDAKSEFNRLDYFIVHKGYKTKEIAGVKSRYRTTYTRWLAHHEAVCIFEAEHRIVERWTPQSVQWQETLKYMSERAYLLALDKLERLFVQRMLEMTKLGMSGLGYKLRDHLMKALKTRADAVRNALNAYNKAAKQLDPPREELSWSKLMEIGNLSEFDLLRDTRQDIRKLPWVKPSLRAAMNLHYRVKRGEEELIRLNVKARRLVTHMIDVEADYKAAYNSHLESNPNLAMEIQARWDYVTRVHTSIAITLNRTSRLKGFTGSLIPGHRVGRNKDIDSQLPRWAGSILGITIEYVSTVTDPTDVSNTHLYHQQPQELVPTNTTQTKDDDKDSNDEYEDGGEFIPRDVEVSGDTVLDMLTAL
ncbi:hypothetical protein BDN72DRAFT_781320 [Pluteus cervinus]|uniref:Uncharacterized protein n=1 Tax=Pluteus cervinus TaxID=181527 RepID=A0ACD3A0R8_9AGAR|nr:hypothetical protein BDN72DRAFT_781320 [Pluteus cervinus]